MNRMKKALAVIEGTLMIDAPEDKRLSFLFRMAHVGLGGCDVHEETWVKELDAAYNRLIADKVISPIV